jgi:hypothetical protein
MSFSFYVQAPSRPALRQLLEDLPFEEIRCCEEDTAEEEEADDEEEAQEAEEEEASADEATDDWPGDFVHLYRAERSLRALELSWDDGTFQVRIMAFSSPEDYELALAIVGRAAEFYESEVTPEDGDAIPLGQFRRKYSQAWAAREIEVLFEMLPKMLDKETGTLQLMGAVRPFHLGQRLMGELRAAGPAEGLTDRIIEAMRRVQNVDQDEYYCASALRVEPRNGGKKFTVAAWAPGVRYLFPQVDYLAVIEPPSGHFLVPYKKLSAIAGDRWSWLDEEQTLVEPFEDEEWTALLERARPFATDPAEEAGGSEESDE